MCLVINRKRSSWDDTKVLQIVCNNEIQATLKIQELVKQIFYKTGERNHFMRLSSDRIPGQTTEEYGLINNYRGRVRIGLATV